MSILALAATLMADDVLTCGAIVKENPTRVEMLPTDLRADFMHPPPFQLMRATPPFSFGPVGNHSGCHSLHSQIEFRCYLQLHFYSTEP